MQRLRLVTTLLRIGIPTNWQVSYTLHTVLYFPSMHSNYTHFLTKVMPLELD